MRESKPDLRIIESDDPRTRMLVYLKERGISEAQADAAGFEALDATATMALAGSGAACGRPSFRIPFYDLDGSKLDFTRWRYLGEAVGFRPSKTDKRPRRFDQEPGSTAPAYFSPLLGKDWRAIAKDTSVDLYLTEGEVKASAACLAGFATVGITGVDNFHVGGDKDRLIRGLDAIEFKTRNVHIVYDSDASTKPGVQRAERELREALERRGTLVQIMRLPPAANGSKQGLDDYLVSEGPDEFRKLINRADRLPDALDDGASLFDMEYPPVEYAIKPYLPKRELAEIHGAHGQFKSTIMLGAALSVASGEPWNDAPVTRGRAVFISLEDRTATLALRVKCWTRRSSKVRGEDTGDARREKAVRSGFQFLGRERAASLAITQTEYGQTFVRDAVVERLVKLCANADLVILETAARLHPAGETNESLAVFANALETIATRTGACVVLVRHVSKEQARSASIDSYGGRGGGSLADAARSVLSVVRDSSPSGEKPDDPVRVVHTKSTHSVRGPDLVWRPDYSSSGVFLRALTAEEKANVSANRLLDKIREAGEEGITRRDLMRGLTAKNRAKQTEELPGLLDRLVKDGAIVARTEKRGRSGPAVEVFRTGEAHREHVARGASAGAEPGRGDA